MNYPSPTIIVPQAYRTQMRIIKDARVYVERNRSATTRDRMDFLTELLRRAAEDYIPTVEKLVDEPGPVKKEIVREELLELIAGVIRRVGIPRLLQPLVRYLLERQLDRLIESVFAVHDARGVVNVVR